MIRLSCRLDIKGDYHIGSGCSAGSIADALILRDERGLPVVRGTSLTGLFREAAARLLETGALKQKGHTGCPPHEPCGDSECVLCHLFGSHRNAKSIRISGATEMSREKKISKAVPPFVQAEVHRRASMDMKTRRTEEAKLFAREEGGPLSMHFSIDCADERTAAFMLAAAKLIDGVGASRRRGLGECSICLEDDNQEKFLLDSFEKIWLQSCKSNHVRPSALEKKKLPMCDLSTEQPLKVRLVVRLDEPALLSRQGFAGNEFETMDYIPGSAVRGAIAQQVVAYLGGVERGGYGTELFNSLIQGDYVRFPMLYPVSNIIAGIGHACLPLPLDIFSCKDASPLAGKSEYSTEKHTACSMLTFGNGAGTKATGCCSHSECGADLRNENGFLLLNYTGNKSPRLLHPEERMEMHNRISGETGRVCKGDLYGYRLLEAGQLFAGDLWFLNQSVWDALRGVTGLSENGNTFEICLGRANRRGYGKATAFCELLTEGHDSLVSVAAGGNRVDVCIPLTVTLLTDAILTDTCGGFAQSLDAAGILETEFRRTLSGRDPELQESAVKVQVLRSYSRSRTIDAFNAKSGLPRSRVIVVQAGSSARIEVSGMSKTDLETLVTNGIGGRRGEGFGRIAFDHPLYGAFASQNQQCLDFEERINVSLLQSETIALPPGHLQRDFIKKLQEYLSDQAAVADAVQWQKAITKNKGTADAWYAAARLVRGISAVCPVEALTMMRTWGNDPNSISKELAERSSSKQCFFHDSDKGKPAYELVERAVQNAAEQEFWQGETALGEAKKTELLLEEIGKLLTLFGRKGR